ncbi:MAG: hypothetical protein HKN23_07690 [Verrucomicrobiales bacterium]|nr:hypothetical protein [Verrucomicrobiales bacterium]
MNRRFAPLLAIFAAVFGLGFAASESQAQVVIYKFDFAKDGPSINYGFYDEAWVVADATGGSASWILTFRSGAQRLYITIEDFGSFFFASKSRTVKGILSAAASDGTPQTSFLAIGELGETVQAGAIRVRVPKSMKGQALSADDESMLPFDSQDGSFGYAGISSMSGKLQVRRSKDANDDRQTVAEAFADVVAYIERRGFTEFDDGTGDDDGDGGGAALIP